MALSEDLPFYRDTLRLLNLLIPLSQGFPRFFRYNMGNRMIELNLDMCVEQQVITERQYAGLALVMDKIGKQGTGWKQYSEKGITFALQT